MNENDRTKHFCCPNAGEADQNQFWNKHIPRKAGNPPVGAGGVPLGSFQTALLAGGGPHLELLDGGTE